MQPASQILYTLAVLGLGLAVGWWLRGAQEPTPPAQDPPRVEQVSKRASEPERLRKPGAEQHFRTLLAEQSFPAAMELFRDIERRDPQLAARLRSQVIAQLENDLGNRDDSALTRLVDAYLSVYDDDTEVLLILARYQLASDYPAEAAHTFQLALAYSQSHPQEHQQVLQAFHSFVEEVDRRLSTEGQGHALIRFYETLQQLDLTQPEYQLRQAELYLAQGETHDGYHLLERLSADPAVAARAESLLQGADPGADIRDLRQSESESLALQAIGSHYHLPLRLNGSQNVNLMIDTGASVTTLSQQRFDSLRDTTRFTELGPQVFNTAGGPSRGTMYRVDTLQLGRHQLPDMTIAVLDFDLPEGVDGLLGMNVLRHFRFEVDQDSEALLLQPR